MAWLPSSSMSVREEVKPLSSLWQSKLHNSFFSKLQELQQSYGAAGTKKNGPFVLVVRCARGRQTLKNKRHTVLPPINHVQTLLSALIMEDTNHYAALDFHSKSMLITDWFTLFEELGKLDKWLLILEIFRWIQEQKWYKPDDGFYSKIISILGRKGQLRLATWLFREMKKHGCRPDSSVFNSLINAHMRNNNNKELALVKALEYFERMKHTTNCKPNLVTYNTLLRACAQAKQHQKMEDLFKEMELAGFKPDKYTFNGVIDALGKTGEFLAMEVMLQKMRKCKVNADFMTYNAMIDAYGKAGFIDKMEEALNGMATAKIQPQLSTFNALINNYGAAKCVDEMELVIKNMSNLGVRPSIITYEVLMKGYGTCKCYEKMQTCLEAMFDAGLRPEVSTLNAVMEAYSSNGLFTEAESLLDNASVIPTSLTYLILYRGYLKHGCIDKIDALLKRMDAAGIMPDERFLMHTLESNTLDSKSKTPTHAADPRSKSSKKAANSRKDSRKRNALNSTNDVLLTS